MELFNCFKEFFKVEKNMAESFNQLHLSFSLFQYVCQKNCGVDTWDSSGVAVFLCKICSETREVR